MNFAQICAFLWAKVKRCFGRVFYHFTIFGFKDEKKLFEENKRFDCSSYQIVVQVITNLSRWLEKIPNALFFCL